MKQSKCNDKKSIASYVGSRAVQHSYIQGFKSSLGHLKIQPRLKWTLIYDNEADE